MTENTYDAEKLNISWLRSTILEYFEYSDLEIVGIYIFGSFVTGDATDDSDCDVVIVPKDKVSRQDCLSYSQEISNRGLQIDGHRVDPHIRSKTDVNEFLRTMSDYSGYSKVYDVMNEEYIKITNI